MTKNTDKDKPIEDEAVTANSASDFFEQIDKEYEETGQGNLIEINGLKFYLKPRTVKDEYETLAQKDDVKMAFLQIQSCVYDENGKKVFNKNDFPKYEKAHLTSTMAKLSDEVSKYLFDRRNMFDDDILSGDGVENAKGN